MNQEPRTVTNIKELDDFPPRPPGEVFPKVLTTLDCAMLLRFDADETATPAKATRNVRLLVKNKGLPVLPRITNGHRFDRDAVLAWWQNLGDSEKTLASEDGDDVG